MLTILQGSIQERVVKTFPHLTFALEGAQGGRVWIRMFLEFDEVRVGPTSASSAIDPPQGKSKNDVSNLFVSEGPLRPDTSWSSASVRR